jgi:sialic acid synthase SpsE
MSQNYVDKAETMNMAYATATKSMAVQVQNLSAMLSAISDVYTAWANEKGVIGNMRVAYRNFLLEALRIIDEVQGGQALETRLKALKAKYETAMLKSDWLNELLDLAKDLKRVTTNYILPYKLTEKSKAPT